MLGGLWVTNRAECFSHQLTKLQDCEIEEFRLPNPIRINRWLPCRHDQDGCWRSHTAVIDKFNPVLAVGTDWEFSSITKMGGGLRRWL